jgi:hypothetical protein
VTESSLPATSIQTIEQDRTAVDDAASEKRPLTNPGWVSLNWDRSCDMPTTIKDLIERIDEFDAEDVIFAKPDWTETAEARLFRLTEDNRAPPEAAALGFVYFLEVDLVRQVLEGFRGKPDTPLLAKVRRVIQYAKFDA